jgi:fumarate hydratase class II
LSLCEEEEKMRIEKETIGEVAIPDKKLCGFNTKVAEHNFPSSSEYVDQNLTKAHLQVKLAAANNNYNIFILPKERASYGRKTYLFNIKLDGDSK